MVAVALLLSVAPAQAQEQAGALESVETALSALLDAVARGLPVWDAALNFLATLVAYLWKAFVTVLKLCLRALQFCVYLISPAVSACGYFLINSGSYFDTMGQSMVIVGDTLSVLPFIGFMWQCFSLCGACCTASRPVEACGQLLVDLSEVV